MRPQRSTTRYLIDTNVLLRLYNRLDPASTFSQQVVQTLLASSSILCITPQNRYELWRVATRPIKENGFGLSSQQARAMLEEATKELMLLQDKPAIYNEWLRLAEQYNVQGKQVHDTRLVAAMNVHRVTHLLTLNPGDFARFAAEIVVVEPSTFLPALL